jgi:hypothetical protein
VADGDRRVKEYELMSDRRAEEHDYVERMDTSHGRSEAELLFPAVEKLIGLLVVKNGALERIEGMARDGSSRVAIEREARRARNV